MRARCRSSSLIRAGDMSAAGGPHSPVGVTEQSAAANEQLPSDGAIEHVDGERAGGDGHLVADHTDRPAGRRDDERLRQGDADRAGLVGFRDLVAIEGEDRQGEIRS